MDYCSFGYNLLGEIVRRVGGAPVEDVARERIFAPLGMVDSHYSLPAALSRRVVRRPPEAPFQELNSRRVEEVPNPSGGAYSTARDLAAFGQMFLSGGRHGAARVLSPASVRAMTRNQIAGISARFFTELFPEASWGLGWDVRGPKKARQYGSLQSPATFGHGGAGGVYLWADPVDELMVVYLSVVMVASEVSQSADFDLFHTAATAAVLDGVSY
jgi:CubicO group peptidase (beta-lactamase class C family)